MYSSLYRNPDNIAPELSRHPFFIQKEAEEELFNFTENQCKRYRIMKILNQVLTP